MYQFWLFARTVPGHIQYASFLSLKMPGTPGERLRLLLTRIVNGVREHPEFILLVQQMLGQEAEGDLHVSLDRSADIL